MKNLTLIAKRYSENRKTYGENDFYKVCETAGNFLNDQTKQNISLYEYLIDNMDPDDFEYELHLIEDNQEYLAQVSTLYVDCLNEGLIHFVTVEEFIETYIEENYGYNGILLYELVKDDLLNVNDFAERIMAECKTDEKEGYETYEYIHKINNENVVIYIDD